MKKLLGDAKVKKADEDLAKAKAALMSTLAANPTILKAAADLLAIEAGDAAEKEKAAFNQALQDLRSVVTATFKIALATRDAGSQGAQGVAVKLTKPVFTSEADEPTFVPLGLLDIAATKEAKNIFAAEASVADALAGVAKAAGALSGCTVDYSIKKKKIQVKVEGGDAEDSSLTEKTAVLRKAVTTANSQIFKLFKACANANGSVNIARALIAVLDALKKKIMSKTGGDMTKVSIAAADYIICSHAHSELYRPLTQHASQHSTINCVYHEQC